MKLTLKTFGGFAATVRRPSKVVDTTSLPADDAEELSRLVAALTRNGSGTTPQAKPDAMSYAIVVEENGRSVTLRGSDTGMTREFAALLDWIARHQ